MSNPVIQPPPFQRPLVGKSGQVDDEQWRAYYLRIQAGLDTGAAPANALYWVSESDGSLTNERDMGALASGYLKVSVSAGQATPSTVTVIPTSDLSGFIATAILTGTLAAAQFPATLPAVNGSALTGLTGPQITSAVVLKTFADSPYTVVATDCTILIDATGGAVTVNLPATVPTGRFITVKKADGSANAVTISGNGNLIDGAANQALAAQWNSKTVHSNGTNWFIVATV